MTSKRPPSIPPSPSGSGRALSIASSTPKLPPISTVTTVPPWAKDEPPSPQDDPSSSPPQLPSHPVSSGDIASFRSNSDYGHSRNGSSLSRWFAFTLPRQAGRFPQMPPNHDPHPPLSRKNSSFRDRRKSWLGSPSLSVREPPLSFSRRQLEKSPAAGPVHPSDSGRRRREWNMSLNLPTPRVPFTANQANSPGWETPWTSRVGAQGPFNSRSRHAGSEYDEEENLESSITTVDSRARRKRLRIFLLNNPYVPLLFRLINISFTTGTLAVAIHIRQLEKRKGVTGIVGSSPTLVIIFAPLTLVHVIGAIYLEYFGRPLGLWRTSAKLGHTLFEVLFICAWSAALSLCFDNFFTSLIPCASPSAIAWYDTLPRPSYNLPTNEGGIGDVLCDSQLALICLVFASLVAYCTNLVISLYRIFEKVKYLPGAPLGLRNGNGR